LITPLSSDEEFREEQFSVIKDHGRIDRNIYPEDESILKKAIETAFAHHEQVYGAGCP
jgi:HD-GYP domain-containing protein (c-di-GMP phosphodiesterase class II)